MIKKATYLIPAVLSVEKDIDDKIVARTILPEVDQLTDPILSMAVKKKTWVDDTLYLETEITFDDTELAVIEAKGWAKI